jgi:molybdopterin-containing oxidoreductase family iron-sulfur binding subunit
VPHYRFDEASLIVGLEADFLGAWLSPVEFTAQYARRRPPTPAMARHVQFESGLSLTGANADRRYGVRPSEIGVVALALLDRVEARDRSRSGDDGVLPVAAATLDDLADQLRAHRGQSLVVCGVDDLAVQVVVARLNHVLGNVGRTIELSPSSLQKQGDDEEVSRLVDEMQRGDVHTLILYGVNPVYDYSDREGFVRGLARVPLSISFADRVDETAAHVHAVCPDHHFLESWGDAEPVNGFFSLTQPTISPLFETRAAPDSLLKWLGDQPDFHTYLRWYWQRHLFPRQTRYRGFDEFWDRTLQAGFLHTPAPAPQSAPIFSGGWTEAATRIRDARTPEPPPGQADRFELHAYETVALRDGRHANNPWLQELPDPITKVTWGNYAAIAPAVGDRLGVKDGEVVAVSNGDTRLELPVCRQPGQSPATVSIARGYGRSAAGRVGNGVGVDVQRFVANRSRGPRSGQPILVTVEKTRRFAALAMTQTHHSMDGRPLVRQATLDELLANAAVARTPPPHPSLWSEREPGSHTWGLSIDLNSCTGCSACVIACQAENNVPVVGSDEVRRGREMHWIRIDRYYDGPDGAPDVAFQPVMCQHCANAPCETVCPVLATVHSSDGINEQIYNRCVGTRYCENNCPYKVRRFNWFAYANNRHFDFNMNSPLGTMVLNPDVVVRSRGVMEKCSLCIQRIQAGKVAAGRSGAAIADGQIQTACQQACPAKAIVFGDMQDRESQVAQARRSPRSYHLLDDLGTRPGVGYLTKIRNRDARQA